MTDTVTLKIPRPFVDLLRCPVCRSPFTIRAADVQCTGCARVFPVVNGVPVLLNESASVFSIADIVASAKPKRRRGVLRKIADAAVPRLGRNVKAAENYRKFTELLPANARVLVIGSGVEEGEGMGAIGSSLQLLHADILTGGTVDVTCDAHDLPFASESFDGVVLQAVLEHVVDPSRCVEEAFRVLKKDGLVYAETPFMQQVHAGAYDFTRFSHLGHRRLFRRFEELESGACCGPGMALARAWRYFLVSFVRSRRAKLLMHLIASFTAFFFVWFDEWLVEKPGGLDAASAVYFLGRKSTDVLGDRELIRQFRGLDHT